MSNSCKITVVIPCFNHGEFLAEAVASVRNAGRDDIELIVVDDGSTDERTRQEMEKLSAQGINVIRQANKGLAAARNAAVLASHGDYIFPLDADDRMREGWISRALRVLDGNAEVGVVYGDAQFFGTSTELCQVGAFDRDRLLYWNVIHASALYRRAVWEQNGGYDGGMPVQGFEDWDFWLGALERGWRFAYLPEVFFEYRRAQESMNTRSAGYEDAVREFVARKHPLLYRDAWVAAMKERETLRNERLSVRAMFRQLSKLVASRVKARMGKNSANSSSTHAQS